MPSRFNLASGAPMWFVPPVLAWFNSLSQAHLALWIRDVTARCVLGLATGYCVAAMLGKPPHLDQTKSERGVSSKNIKDLKQFHLVFRRNPTARHRYAQPCNFFAFEIFKIPSPTVDRPPVCPSLAVCAQSEYSTYWPSIRSSAIDVTRYQTSN